MFRIARLRDREAGIIDSARQVLSSIRAPALPRAHGNDLSRYDQWYVPATNPPKPLNFTIQRSGYGAKKDDKFEVIYEGTQYIDLRMTYHYFSTAVEWKEQADKCLEITIPYNFHAYWLDYETAFNNIGESSYNDAYKWIQYMKQNVGGRKVGFYTNRNIYKNLMNPYGDWHHEEEFWYAIYHYSPKPFISTPAMPPGRTKPFDIWQYGITNAYGNPDDGRDYGVARSVMDVDVAMMTKHELYTKYKGDYTPFPLPEPTDKEKLDRLWDLHPELHPAKWIPREL